MSYYSLVRFCWWVLSRPWTTVTVCAAAVVHLIAADLHPAIVLLALALMLGQPLGVYSACLEQWEKEKGR